MGLTAKLRGARSPEVDYWILRFREDGSGDWRSPDIGGSDFDPERMGEPIPENDIRNRAEIENWPPGVYQLMGRKSNAGFTGAEWTFQIEAEEEDDVERELTEEEKLELAAQRAIQRKRESGPWVSTPDEMMGAIGAKVLDGSMPEDVDMGQLAEFVDTWQNMTTTAPTSPDEVAGITWQAHMAAGNTQVATAILSDWFAATSGGDSSLMDRALESGEANVSWETIKALGALKFLDDPRSMVREVGGGMLEADAGGGGRAGGAGAGSALAALFEGSTAVAGAGGPGKARSVDEAEADPAGGGGRAEAYTPRRPTEAVAVDLETLGAERAEKAAKADGDGEEPDSGGDGPAELPDVETDDTGGAPGLDEAMDGIEDEIDREAGEYPNAAEAMQTLDEAAEADDAASAKRRRRQ